MSYEAKTRDYEDKDLAEVQRILKENESLGIKINLTDLKSPLFIVKRVLTVDGKIRCAVFSKIEAEAILVLDKSDWGDPDQKLLAVKVLQDEGLDSLWKQGIDEVVCWTTQKVSKFFGKRLRKLGWYRDNDGMQSWVQSTKPKEKSNVK